MDFHSLSRRELQALCKRNKIPANITNVAMADSLKALDFVEGLEDALITEKTSVNSPTKTKIKQSVPRTSCRTSTRRKPIKEEPQTTQISTRTRGGTRRAVAGVEDNNNAAAPLDLVRRKMESQLKEAAEDDNKWAETPSVVVSRRKIGTTSVREEGYNTRKSTRLLEKKTIEMNLDNKDDDDDDQIVERDAAKKEESVVFDKGMELEGINQEKTPTDLVETTDVVVDEKPAVLLEDSFMNDNDEKILKVELQQISEAFDELEKTDVSDEKPAVLLEDRLSLMGDNEEDSLKVELQQISKAFDELEVHVDVGAEVFDENKGYLESELTKIESHTDCPTAGLVLDNEEGLNAEKELNDVSSDQFEIDQEAYRVKDVVVPSLGEEKSEGNFSPNRQEYEESVSLIETVTDFTKTIGTGPEESMITEVTHTSEVSSVDDEVCEDLCERPTGLSQLPSEETIAFQNGCEEKCDQPPIIISDMKDLTSFEKCDQISSCHVISERTFNDHSEGKVCINDEISEIKELKATENINNLPDINKENFVKENTEKVNKDTKDLSIRQLRKMLKQMQITDKNTDSKETEKISKMGRARAALQPLSDNCLTTSKSENGN